MKKLKLLLVFIFGFISVSFADETLTITTYYPSPYGIYNELTTTGNTYLATSGGNVGIGTTSPAYLLDVNTGINVNKSGTVTSGFANGVSIAGWDALGYNSTGGDLNLGGYRASQWTGLRFYTSSSPQMYINSTGNVGIGTTSPAAQMHVYASSGDVQIKADSAAADSYITLARAGANKWGLINDYAGTNYLSIYDYTRADDVLVFKPNSDSYFKNGNVGIGTTSPGAKLDVVGPAITGSPWLAEVIRFSSVTYPSQYGSIMIDMGGASGGISFGVAGARSLYIAQTSGNVGIGLTNPSYQLQLSSDSAAKPGLPPGPLPLI